MQRSSKHLETRLPTRWVRQARSFPFTLDAVVPPRMPARVHADDAGKQKHSAPNRPGISGLRSSPECSSGADSAATDASKHRISLDFSRCAGPRKSSGSSAASRPQTAFDLARADRGRYTCRAILGYDATLVKSFPYNDLVTFIQPRGWACWAVARQRKRGGGHASGTVVPRRGAIPSCGLFACIGNWGFYNRSKGPQFP